MAALLSVLVASCTSTGMTEMSADIPAYAGGDTPAAASSAIAADDLQPGGEQQALMAAEGAVELPAAVAYLPSPAPASIFGGGAGRCGSDRRQYAAVLAGGRRGNGRKGRCANPGGETAGRRSRRRNGQRRLRDGRRDAEGAGLRAGEEKELLASLFGSSPAQAAATPIVEVSPAREGVKPVLTLASVEDDDKPLIDLNEMANAAANGALPGVRQTALFEIRRRSGLDDESDVDLHEDEEPGLYRVASAAGLARLAPNGLLKQTEGVDVACLKPSLVRVLKTIEQHYGKKMVVTSGYRDPVRNRRARGARRSLHMYCAAADIQVPGISKWELASYVRSMPGRGGVGTYCHTESVHVDVGPERDWNWRCRRRK